jgi:hypothetical protein
VQRRRSRSSEVLFDLREGGLTRGSSRPLAWLSYGTFAARPPRRTGLQMFFSLLGEPQECPPATWQPTAAHARSSSWPSSAPSRPRTGGGAQGTPRLPCLGSYMSSWGKTTSHPCIHVNAKPAIRQFGSSACFDRVPARGECVASPRPWLSAVTERGSPPPADLLRKCGPISPAYSPSDPMFAPGAMQ